MCLIYSMVHEKTLLWGPLGLTGVKVFWAYLLQLYDLRFLSSFSQAFHPSLHFTFAGSCC